MPTNNTSNLDSLSRKASDGNCLLPPLFGARIAGRALGILVKRASLVVFCVFVQLSTLNFSLAQPLPQQPSNAGGEQAKQDDQTQLSLEALEDFFLDGAAAFKYRQEGRPDPFMPFITQEMIQAEMEVARGQLTGMQQFEPGQLKLVAIVVSGSGPLAMVEDSTGKGYLIRKGTKIGRSGEVVNIIPNKVLIRQLSYTMTQKKRYKTVEMVLKREGEK